MLLNNSRIKMTVTLTLYIIYVRNIFRKSFSIRNRNRIDCVIINNSSPTNNFKSYAKNMSLLKYKYFDSPDGEDIYKKTICLSKYAAMAGFGSATFDVLMYSHPKGPLSTAGRYLFYIGPLVGMASAFAITTNVAKNVRGKNDAINYFIGGTAASSIFSAWARSMTIAVPMSCVLGVLGMIVKTAHEEGLNLRPDFPQATKTALSVKHDWTLVKDIPELKTWTTGQEGN